MASVGMSSCLGTLSVRTLVNTGDASRCSPLLWFSAESVKYQGSNWDHTLLSDEIEGKL